MPILKRIRRHERREERREERKESSSPTSNSRKKILEGEGPIQKFMRTRKKPLQNLISKKKHLPKKRTEVHSR